MKTIENFFVHWKTSLFGILAAAANAAANGTSPKQILVSVTLALIGLFASDAQVTPITSVATKTPMALLALLLIPAMILGQSGCWLSSGNNFEALTAIVQSGANYVATVSGHPDAESEISEAVSVVNSSYVTYENNPNPSTLSELQAEGQNFAAQLNSIFQSFGVTDPNTQALIQLTAGEINAVLNLIPASAPNAGVQAKAKGQTKPAGKVLSTAQYKKTFNAIAGKKAI